MNRKISVRLVTSVAVMGMLLLASICMAAEFSANVVQKMSSKQMGSMDITGKVYAKGLIQRQEVNSPMGKQIVITRPDKGVVWVISPATKSYTETKIPKIDMKKAPSIESLIKKNPNLKSLGTEKISGYVCKKYKYNDPQTKTTGTIWVSTKLQQELKTSIQSTRGSMTMLMTNIKEAKQPDSLFAIPRGYKKQEMRKMPGMGGAPGKGGMPGMPPMPPK